MSDTDAEVRDFMVRTLRRYGYVVIPPSDKRTLSDYNQPELRNETAVEFVGREGKWLSGIPRRPVHNAPGGVPLTKKQRT
jgi:hypothetical protein